MPWEETDAPVWQEVGNIKGEPGTPGEEGPPGPPGNEESLAQFLDQFQPKRTVLTALSDLAFAADRLAYFTSAAGEMALTTLSAFGRSLMAAGNASAVRSTLDVFSKAETTAQVVPTALMGSAIVGANVPCAGNKVLGSTAGYIPGLGCVVTGDGRPAMVHVHISSVKWPETVVYAYLNQNDVLKITNQSKGVPPTDPGNTMQLTYMTNPLVAGQQYRFDVGFRTGGGKAGTLVAGIGYESQIVVHRL